MEQNRVWNYRICQRLYRYLNWKRLRTGRGQAHTCSTCKQWPNTLHRFHLSTLIHVTFLILQNLEILKRALYFSAWVCAKWLLSQKQRMENVAVICTPAFTIQWISQWEHPLFWQMPGFSNTSFIIITALLKFHLIHCTNLPCVTEHAHITVIILCMSVWSVWLIPTT